MNQHHRNTLSGFTLVELLIVVTLVGILAAVALPSYRNHVLRTHRTVAKTALVDLASRQESFYVDRKAYSSALSDFGLQTYVSRDNSTSASSSSESVYKISIASLSLSACPAPSATVTAITSTEALSGVGYTLVAQPVGSQTSDSSCGSICLRSTGVKLSSAGTAATCWSR